MPRTIDTSLFPSDVLAPIIRAYHNYQDRVTDRDFFRRNAKRSIGLLGGLDGFRAGIGSTVPSRVGVIGDIASSRLMEEKAVSGTHAALRQLGDLLAAEDLVEGDEAIIDGELFGLKSVGYGMKFIGGQACDVELLVAVHLGSAPDRDDD